MYKSWARAVLLAFVTIVESWILPNIVVCSTSDSICFNVSGVVIAPTFIDSITSPSEIKSIEISYEPSGLNFHEKFDTLP